MQNKGAIRFIAIALALVSLYQLSFTYVTRRVEKQAREYATDSVFHSKKYEHYLDSMSQEKVYPLFGFNYKYCKEREINLGLDLKGGMFVKLEVSVADLIRVLSNNSQDSSFVKAMKLAQQMPGSEHFVDKFGRAFKQVAPNARLASIFSTPELKGKVTFDSSDDDVLQVLREEADNAIDNSFNILRNRIDKFGVAQPNIQRLENSGLIVIELPGIKEPERVRKLLQGTANLEFWETYELSEILDNFVAANKTLAEINKAKVEAVESDKQQVEEETKAENSEDELLSKLKETEKEDTLQATTDMAKEYPLFSILQLNLYNNQPAPGPVVGYSHFKDTAKVNQILKMPKIKALFPPDVKFRWGVKPPKWDEKKVMYELVALKITTRDGSAPLDGGAISDAREAFGDQKGSAEVDMEMNAEGARIWARMTGDNIGRCIAIVLDNYVYSYPRVQTEIRGGRSQITGDFTVEEAKDLANVLKSGKLPAPARIVEEQLVGPSLGKEAINAGLRSFIASFIIVLIFMVFYYSRSAGLVADFALLANLFFIMGVLASFGATLTLPGIAGIVLTMGMAVDANVLIFERIREEIRAGKGLSLAVKDGYKNALSAIIDGNVTTFLTGVILYLFGSGPIRGFATTLMIGIATSMFSGIFITRLVLLWMEKKNLPLIFSTKISKNAFQGLKIDFIGLRKKAYVISSILILGAIISLAIRGLNPGIDFIGGRSYIVRFSDNVSTVDVSKSLKTYLGEAPEVKTIGNANQVKITTKYKIDVNDENVDNEVDSLIYLGVKPFMDEGATFNDFQRIYKQSSIKVGPTIAHDIKRDAYIAIFFALIVIFIYILIRFRYWSYSAGGVVALFHDSIITIGMFSVLYHRVPFNMEIDQSFIAAILTIIGYSINDSVIIFDRIREYIGLHPKRDRKENMNNAINDTLSRTFSTSFSTLVVLIPMFFFGGEVIRGFVFALIVGILIGTYSSVFVSAPVAYDLEKNRDKKKKK
ncbi:protein translocase subunit SecDF [Tenuifilum thalassicum]|uniref:Multifunctional fusion protein n=1 Tax=Tenuifilum thalassicum TaxID=2590900 RepID=A0A7D3XK42_9BACT|nr:protein translocase subunit SecDF [Tenuifilum thalassicum]QKG79135.1 protein translocase subunit SecDF [Tenuifilum thalassicum]